MLSFCLSNLTPPHKLSSLGSISNRADVQFLWMMRYPQLSITKLPDAPFKTTTIRMGGGPRTFPGGVSKWQWKRMQAKKAKQLIKARLARERQIYEMRKRAELKAAVSELERPWEVVEKAPNLFSVSADEQVKVLADRFQKPGGFDMWSERDGPELFQTGNGLPSARYFPKGVVHSIKPYGKVEKFDDGSDEFEGRDADDDTGRGPEGKGVRERGVEGPRVGDKYANVKNGIFNGKNNLNSKFRNPSSEGGKGNGSKNKSRNNYNRKNSLSTTTSTDNGFFRGKNERFSRQNDGDRKNSLSTTTSTDNGFFRGKNERFSRQNDGDIDSTRRSSMKRVENLKSMVFDLTLRKDGSYEIEPEKI